MELGPWVKVVLRPGQRGTDTLVLQPVEEEDTLEGAFADSQRFLVAQTEKNPAEMQEAWV